MSFLGLYCIGIVFQRIAYLCVWVCVCVCLRVCFPVSWTLERIKQTHSKRQHCSSPNTVTHDECLCLLSSVKWARSAGEWREVTHTETRYKPIARSLRRVFLNHLPITLCFSLCEWMGRSGDCVCVCVSANCCFFYLWITSQAGRPPLPRVTLTASPPKTEVFRCAPYIEGPGCWLACWECGEPNSWLYRWVGTVRSGSLAPGERHTTSRSKDTCRACNSGFNVSFKAEEGLSLSDRKTYCICFYHRNAIWYIWIPFLHYVLVY